MAKAKLYIDEDITDLLARSLRSRGFDAVSAHEVGMRGQSDEEQLDYAIRQNRAFLTCNIRHFPNIAESYYVRRIDHYGIIVSTQLDFGEMLRRIIFLLENWSAEELKNTFLWLTPVG